MVRFEHRFVKRQSRRRKRQDGTSWQRIYYYYRRPGAPDDGARLPDDPLSPEFAAAIRAMNARAESRSPEQQQGTFAHLVVAYRASPDFTGLREKTRRDYGRILTKLSGVLGAIPAADIDREVVYAIRDKMAATPFMANYTLRVLRLLFGWAVERRQLAENPAARPRQLRVKSRNQVWSPAAEATFLEHASAPMALAFALQAFTAQRQADVLAMTWSQYQGGTIRLKQQKGGALVEVPAHVELRTVLEATKRVSTHILTDERGLPFKGDNFRHQWRAVTLAAGLDGLQNRDLRRTAMVRMAEAGATDIQIAAVSGHAIEDTRRILETYIPRSSKMAEMAVRKLEAAGRSTGTE